MNWINAVSSHPVYVNLSIITSFTAVYCFKYEIYIYDGILYFVKPGPELLSDNRGNVPGREQ